MRSILYTLLILISSLQFSSCGSGKYAHKSGEKPQWILQHPNEEGFYHGVGSSNMNYNPEDYIQVAKKNALSDLTGAISVKISSNTVFKQIEDNNNYIQEFESDIRVSMQDELEGFELLDSWTDTKTKKYWVYYRLSKQKYADIKRQKLERAKKLSKKFYEEARTKTKEGDVQNALILFSKSIDAIKNHLDDDLSVFTSEGPVELSTAIHKGIQDLYGNISFFSQRPEINITVLSSSDEKLPLATSYQLNGRKTRHAGIPIHFHFTKGDGVVSKRLVSDAEGKMNARISKMISKEKHQEITASLDIDFLINGNTMGHKLNHYFFAGKNLPKFTFQIEVERLNAFLVFEEQIFDKKATRGLLENNFKKELSKSLYNFTQNKSNADLTVKVRTNTTKGDIEKNKHYSAYIVYIDFFISIENKNGIEVFNDGFEDVKGMRADSYKHATRDGYEKIINKVNESIVPKLSQLAL